MMFVDCADGGTCAPWHVPMRATMRNNHCLSFLENIWSLHQKVLGLLCDRWASIMCLAEARNWRSEIDDMMDLPMMCPKIICLH
jgi:hypothetical protein